jgi:hypothetical protein
MDEDMKLVWTHGNASLNTFLRKDALKIAQKIT